MTDGTLRAPVYAFETIADVDAAWRQAVAILAALFLHLAAILALLDEFPRPTPSAPEPIPVELAFEPPAPAEPPVPEPQPAPEPMPERRSGGDLEHVAPGQLPIPSETAAAATDEAPAMPPPAPTPPIPETASPQAEPVPPPQAAPPTQQTLLVPPLPPAKPRAPAASPAPASTPPEPPAAPASPDTILRPGEGGGDRYLKSVRDDILAHMVYPPTAELFRLRGVATYEIVIDRQGNLLQAQLARSSGLALLDNAGLQTIRLAAPFGPVPEEFSGKTIGLTLVLPIVPER
jgi:TonB family protein